MSAFYPSAAVRHADEDGWFAAQKASCGGDVHAERRFGDVPIPSRLSVGWWYGAPQYKPLSECDISTVERLA